MINMLLFGTIKGFGAVIRLSMLSGNYTFGASPPSHAPYGTVFFIEE